LAISFHFNYLFNEKDQRGAVIYVVILFTWIAFDFRISRLSLINYLKPFALSIFLLVLIYLPSLIVKENYASNRTLFALNVAVFVLVGNTLLVAIKKYRSRLAVVTLLSLLFVANAYYNFKRQFLDPVKNEYRQVRAFIEQGYNPGINAIYFIQPHEDFFVKKYGITRSWDEFGVPSTFFEWTPEFLVKQVIFEKTGDRQTADKLIIKTSLIKDDLFKTADSTSQKVMIIDGPLILTKE